ncbi:MAG TPA: PAS domain-containing sensor histidine kinase [Puia sp.]|nr:PAS domain-containing sensor histidine kinase [Puia sp.]
MTGLFLLALVTWRYENTAAARSAFAWLLGGLFLLLIALFIIVLHNLDRRKSAERKYKASEARFALLVRDVKDLAIFMIDPDGQVMSWNRGAERIKGYAEQEIIGRPISLFYIEEDVRKGEPAANLKRALEEGRYESLGWRRKKDGSTFFADVLITPLYDEGGQLEGFAKITRDITDKKRAEEDIQRSLQREQELNEMKSRFLSLASHEFKTPLSVILSSAALIEKYRGAEDADKRSRHIQRIKSNVSNLRQILNDFLSVEQLEKGIIRSSPSVLDLPAFLKETLQNMTEACKTGQQFELSIRGTERKVILDAHLLGNVLNNLLSNAIKYSGEESIIRVFLDFGPDFLRFTVKDQGIGIPAAEQTHLFEEFFRASNANSVSGTGLGLSIVRKYIDLMAGTITFSSAPGEGTEFIITLPSRIADDGSIGPDGTSQVSSDYPANYQSQP